MIRTMKFNKAWLLVAVVLLTFGLLAPAAASDTDDGSPERDGGNTLVLPNRSDSLAERDAATAGVVSSGPTARTQKNIDQRGRGDRFDAESTTDVWAYSKYAYTGTFQSPCGGSDPGAGVWVWDIRNPNDTKSVGVIASEAGDRSNDVKVAGMNSGDILVMSNESCGGGDGGFEIYNVDNPESPVKLASVTIDELNPISDALFGGITEVGVHNLFLFTRGSSDYVGVVAATAFDNFMIFDITDPSNPTLASSWGAEESFDPGVGASGDFGRTLNAALWLLDGVGASENRFLHDITITADGTQAYLANWDAGLILLDISDVTDPQLVSVALDIANGSLDGEVNSHAVWPSEDGSIVVEGEEDFSAWEATAPPGNLTMDSPFPGDPTIPGTAISTVAGDDFTANQTGNIGTTDGTSVVVTSGVLIGNTYAAIELATAAGSPTFASTGPLTGELVFIGRACATSQGDAILNAGDIDPGDIAVVRRGACFFEEKADTAASLGAAAVIIANNNPVSTPWSGLRIWDYSDPTNPVLAATFNTTCSASTAPGGACDPAGTYSVHNVIVETTGNKTMAYVSWYSDGMLVLDVSDPYNPVEVGRFLDDSTNGGEPNDFWGVYKERNSPWIYGSDRNGGLYTFKEQGSGSGK